VDVVLRSLIRGHEELSKRLDAGLNEVVTYFAKQDEQRVGEVETIRRGLKEAKDALDSSERKSEELEGKLREAKSEIAKADLKIADAESRLTAAEKKTQKQESRLRQVIQFLVDSELKNSKGDGGPTDLSVRITVLSETLGMMGSLYGSMGPKAKQYFMLEEISLKQGMPAGSSGAGTGIVLLFSPTDRWMDSLGKPLLQALEG